MQPKLTSFIEDTLYQAKHAYGRPISIQRISQTVGADLVTSDVVQEVRIRKAVVLDSTISREFIQRLVAIVANRDFTYGTYFDRDEKKFMVMRRDLYQKETKTFFEPKDKDAVIYQGRRWEIIRMTRFEDDQGFVIHGREVKGNSPNVVASLGAKSRALISHNASI
jgi:hypothetical protein